MKELDNIQVARETYNVIAGYFSPILSSKNASKDEIEFIDFFLTEINQGGYIADLGCGVGKHGRYCASKGYKVTGYDISEEMIKLAKENNTICKMEALHIANMCEIETSILYDGIVAMYSLIHLTEEQMIKTLTNIKRCMKLGARMVLSVYHGDRLGYYQEALDSDFQLYYKDYRQEEIKELVKKAGFKIIETRVWNDDDEITASNANVEYGVIGLVLTNEE